MPAHRELVSAAAGQFMPQVFAAQLPVFASFSWRYPDLYSWRSDMALLARGDDMDRLLPSDYWDTWCRVLDDARRTDYHGNVWHLHISPSNDLYEVCDALLRDDDREWLFD